jgi:subtilisin family serine protease
MTRTRTVVTLVLALVMVTATVATPVAAASGSSTSAKLGPSVAENVGWFSGWTAPQDVQRYGAGDLPGWLVEVDSESASKLESWANASEEREVREAGAEGRWFVVSAPADDVLRAGLISTLTGQETLVAQSYVSEIGVNRRTSLNPIREPALEESSAWEAPDGTWVTTLLGGGSLSADGAAWSDEINRSGLDDVRAAVDDDQVSLEGDGVRVAVLDTGLDYSEELHEDHVPMAYNAITGENVSINDTANATASDYELVADGSSSNHGSWVATMIAGNGSTVNGTGVAPNATLIPVKVLADDGSGSTADIAEGIEWAAGEADADVISMSLGSAVPSERINSEITEALENESVSAVVVAAGNSRMTYRYLASPAGQEPVVTVAATDAKALNESESAYFSNVGPDPQTAKNPTVGAPGMSITATVADGNVTLSGTSMATPVVSGLAAVTLQANPSLEGEPAKLKQFLADHAEPLEQAGVTEVGAGRPDSELLVDDVEPDQDQEDARNDPAQGRDSANQALSTGFWGSLLG